MPAIESAFNHLEARLQSLIEGTLTRLFPVSSWQAELAQRLSEALRTSAQRNMGVMLAPDRYTIFLPPGQAILFLENPALLTLLAEQLDQAAVEAGYRFRTAPILNVAPSSDLEDRAIQVVAQFSLEQSGHTDYFVAEQPQPEHLGAFLIVDGTRLFSLTERVINIGRLSENDLVIQDGRVSRRHAQIRLVHDQYMIFDLGSSGGTYVNDVRITQSVLKPGDIISLAGVPLVFGMESGGRSVAPTQELKPRRD